VFERFINAILRVIIRVVFRLDAHELSKLPLKGPAILVSNHTSNLEGPIYYVLIQPREATGLAKRELWENPATRFFMQLWGLIPVSRGRPDPKAINRALRALEKGKFLGIAPEGTRSRSGELQRGFPGTALLATAKQVPIYPMAHWGMTELSRNLRRLRRTPLTFKIGRPFLLLRKSERRPSLEELREMTDEMMYQLALLLPDGYRGYYRDLSRLSTKYLRFLGEGA
jgi:1-acyl-sn-glycerol-3-phosphate acyltransferase